MKRQAGKKTIIMNYFTGTRKTPGLFFLLVLFTTIGCNTSISFFDQYAYTQATSLKVDLQNLAQESSNVTYTDAKSHIDKVNLELQKAYEYSKGRAKNTISTEMYATLLSETGFYKSFLKLWESQGKNSQTGSFEMATKLGQLMDQVIGLEAGKNKQK
jgi:hypothetical protein